MSDIVVKGDTGDVDADDEPKDEKSCLKSCSRGGDKVKGGLALGQILRW